ncbi:MAG: hypothetical protein SPJ45_09670, partial [Anaerovoracaceae bacterium]|nr:hypothetical protein [Anaerovoracaceae bacterium]
PTWVDRYNGSSDYRIIPLDGDLDSNETLLKSGHLSRAKQALSDVKDLIGEKWLSGVTIQAEGTSGDEENEDDAEAA